MDRRLSRSPSEGLYDMATSGKPPSTSDTWKTYCRECTVLKTQKSTLRIKPKKLSVIQSVMTQTRSRQPQKVAKSQKAGDLPLVSADLWRHR